MLPLNHCIMTSSNGNIFRVTGPLCGEFADLRWIPRTKASDAELWWFFDLRLNKRFSKQSWGWWFESLSIPFWSHCNGQFASLRCDTKDTRMLAREGNIRLPLSLQWRQVISTVYLDTDQRIHQSSASLAFVRGIHRRPMNSPHKWPVTRKMFPFDNVIMWVQGLTYDLRLSLWLKQQGSLNFTPRDYSPRALVKIP